MKSKIERELDEEFEKFGIRPQIYHFRDIPLFNAVTVATPDTRTWGDIANIILKLKRPESSLFTAAEYLRWGLSYHLKAYGVAICDRRDPFNRKLGRIIAKGRLLKHLKKEAK